MMGKVTTWKFMAPPAGFLHGILVDRKGGKRFTNEDVYNAKVVDRQMSRADGHSWLLLDSKMVEAIRRDTADPGNDLLPFQRMMAVLNTEALAKQAHSWSGLAQACGLPAEAVLETVRGYNEGVRAGHDGEFGKQPKYMRELATAPFYAVPVDSRLGAAQRLLLRNLPTWAMELTRYLPTMPLVKLGAKFGLPLPPSPSMSLGGLKVDLQQRVLRQDDFRPIPGLFAAGRSAAGVASGGYVSGMSIADAIYSGRHAGRQAALDAVAHEQPPLASPLAAKLRPLQPVATSKL